MKMVTLDNEVISDPQKNIMYEHYCVMSSNIHRAPNFIKYHLHTDFGISHEFNQKMYNDLVYESWLKEAQGRRKLSTNKYI